MSDLQRALLIAVASNAILKRSGFSAWRLRRQGRDEFEYVPHQTAESLVRMGMLEEWNNTGRFVLTRKASEALTPPSAPHEGREEGRE